MNSMGPCPSLYFLNCFHTLDRIISFLGLKAGESVKDRLESVVLIGAVFFLVL